MDRIIIIIITAGTKLFSNDLQFTANFERSGNSFEINRPSQRERKRKFSVGAFPRVSDGGEGGSKGWPINWRVHG